MSYSADSSLCRGAQRAQRVSSRSPCSSALGFPVTVYASLLFPVSCTLLFAFSHAEVVFHSPWVLKNLPLSDCQVSGFLWSVSVAAACPVPGSYFLCPFISCPALSSLCLQYISSLSISLLGEVLIICPKQARNPQSCLNSIPNAGITGMGHRA